VSEALIVSVPEAHDSPAPAAHAQRAVLPAIRDATLVATVYLFFAGYVYRQFYLTNLGLPASGEPSINSVLVDAFGVFYYNPWLGIVLLIAACALSAHRVRELLDKALMPVVVGTAILGFFVLDGAASSAAKREAAKAFAASPDLLQVSITFRTPLYAKLLPKLVLATSGDAAAKHAGWQAYVLSVSTDTDYVVVHSPARDVSIYAIPRADVLAIQGYRGQ